MLNDLYAYFDKITDNHNVTRMHTLTQRDVILSCIVTYGLLYVFLEIIDDAYMVLDVLYLYNAFFYFTARVTL